MEAHGGLRARNPAELEDPDRTVCLVEAGPDYGAMRADGGRRTCSTRESFRCPTSGRRSADGRPRGRGSSAVAPPTTPASSSGAPVRTTTNGETGGRSPSSSPFLRRAEAAIDTRTDRDGDLSLSIAPCSMRRPRRPAATRLHQRSRRHHRTRAGGDQRPGDSSLEHRVRIPGRSAAPAEPHDRLGDARRSRCTGRRTCAGDRVRQRTAECGPRHRVGGGVRIARGAAPEWHWAGWGAAWPRDRRRRGSPRRKRAYGTTRE